MRFDDGTEHLVLIPKNTLGIGSNPYLYQVELCVSVGGKQIFSSANRPTSVDCANLLAHDCAEWAQCMRANHNERVAKVGIGTHCGADEWQWYPYHHAEWRRQKVEKASCVGYLISATSRGHREFGLPSLWRVAMEMYRSGSKERSPQGHIRKRSGVGLVKGLVEDACWTPLYWMTAAKVPADDKTDAANLVRERFATLAAVRRDGGLYYGMQMAEIIAKGSAEWNAQLRTVLKVPYALACIHGGSHTAIILNGELYQAISICGPKKEVFGAERYSETVPGRNTGWPDEMLLCVPPGLWERARAQRG